MNKKISDKDKKDWDEFISSKESLPDKDEKLKKKIGNKLKTFDLLIELAGAIVSLLLLLLLLLFFKESSAFIFNSNS